MSFIQSLIIYFLSPLLSVLFWLFVAYMIFSWLIAFNIINMRNHSTVRIYNLIRKKINVDTDIGLLIESLFILPFALVTFYMLTINGHNDFKLSNPPLMLLIFLAGPMTVIPLFLYVRGVELCGLGPTGMIFYITPTLQFLLGFFYYHEPFSISKLVSFIFIWIAVIIYLKDLYETN